MFFRNVGWRPLEHCVLSIWTANLSMNSHHSPVFGTISQSIHHYYHLPPCIRSLDLFRQRRVAIVSWGVRGPFFLEVCSWGRVSEVWCCPFFQDGWSSFVYIWLSRLVFQRSPGLFLWLRFLFCLVLCILWHFSESASLQLLGESSLVSWLLMFRYHTVVLVWLRIRRISFGCLYGFL